MFEAFADRRPPGSLGINTKTPVAEL